MKVNLICRLSNGLGSTSWIGRYDGGEFCPGYQLPISFFYHAHFPHYYPLSLPYITYLSTFLSLCRISSLFVPSLTKKDLCILRRLDIMPTDRIQPSSVIILLPALYVFIHALRKKMVVTQLFGRCVRGDGRGRQPHHATSPIDVARYPCKVPSRYIMVLSTFLSAQRSYWQPKPRSKVMALKQISQS